MARIRTIKPKFFQSDDVTPLSYRARLTWIGLWTYVDDDGRGVDNARLIKGDLWPLEDDVTWQDVEADLDELHRADRISRYIVDGKRFLAIRKWEDHQVISRPTPSKLPEATGENMWYPDALTEASLNAPGVHTAGIGRGSGTGNREEELEVELPRAAAEPTTDDLFAEFWDTYPRKEAKPKALTAYRQALGRADAATILAGAVAYRDDPNREQAFTKIPTTWIHGDCWNDPPIPTRSPGREGTSDRVQRQTAALWADERGNGNGLAGNQSALDAPRERR